MRTRSVRRSSRRRSGRGIKQTSSTIGYSNVVLPSLNRLKRRRRAGNGNVRKRTKTGTRSRSRTGGSRTGTDVIQKRAEFGDQYVQNLRRFINQGRKLRTVPYLSKLASTDGSPPYDLGHRVYANFSTTPAEVIGLNTYGSATLTYYPVFVFDLTNANYQTGSTYSAPAVLRLLYDSALGRMTWQQRYGMDPDGTFTNAISAMQPNGLKVSDSKVVFPRSFMEYLSMNFNFTGPQTKPARVTLELVVFTDEWADPFGDSGWNQSGLDQDHIAHGRFWAAEAARLCENPIHKIARYQRRMPYRVLSRKTIDFQPTSSTESDTRGHIQTVKWFRRINRVLNYQARDAGPYNASTIHSEALLAPTVAGQPDNLSNRPQKSARFQLIVKANCWDLDTAATPSLNTNVRIEWNITARHRSGLYGSALPNP